ncbi:glycoside hydrolase family 25 protein [Streptomyces sp. NPDC090073]|uniref:glycoside hydrolase family 25 protein n=1 Tax=Streptomyces sp. NPDC090073 TaxID=3365936 RepID=UPI00380A2BCA
MISGIDVASYQSETYPTSGLDFVLIKATEGKKYVNPKMARQAATARTAGLVVGFYHFLHTGDIKAQAAYFVEKAVSLEGDLLVCDWETPPGGRGASNAEKDAFLAEVKRLRPGHRVGLYCNRDYWLNRDNTSQAGDFLWIADPGKAGFPHIKAKWRIHQYKIDGGTDRNVADFTSRAAMREWAGYPASKPTPRPPAPKPTEPTLQSLNKRVTDLEKVVAALQKKVG